MTMTGEYPWRRRSAGCRCGGREAHHFGESWGYPGPQHGRWIRRGSKLILLDLDLGHGHEGFDSELEGPSARPSQWVLPASVRAAGERQSVRYDSPPAWGPGSCTGSFRQGAAELRRYILATFPGVSGVGGYNCRQNSANRAETSVHGTGRALDVMIPMVGGGANAVIGDPIANWLVENASAIGVQYIIWNHVFWNGSRNPPKQGAYRGPNPHVDHIHVELDEAGASRATPWFHRATGAGAPSPGT